MCVVWPTRSPWDSASDSSLSSVRVDVERNAAKETQGERDVADLLDCWTRTGASTGLCVLAAMLFKKRLNMTLLVLANLVAAPFTLAMFVPFMRVGEMLTGSSAFPLSVEKIRSLVWSSPGKIVGALFHSVAGWFIICPFLAFALINILTPSLQYARAKLHSKDRRTSTSQEV